MAGTSPAHSTVIFAGGAARTGATLSSTVIVCVAVAGFPQGSAKVHVLVIVPPHAPPIKAPSTPTTDPGAAQLSV